MQLWRLQYFSERKAPLKQYQEKVVETIGEDKEKELRQTITLDKMAKQPEETPVIVPEPATHLMTSWSSAMKVSLEDISRRP